MIGAKISKFRSRDWMKCEFQNSNIFPVNLQFRKNHDPSIANNGKKQNTQKIMKAKTMMKPLNYTNWTNMKNIILWHQHKFQQFDEIWHVRILTICCWHCKIEFGLQICDFLHFRAWSNYRTNVEFDWTWTFNIAWLHTIISISWRLTNKTGLPFPTIRTPEF